MKEQNKKPLKKLILCLALTTLSISFHTLAEKKTMIEHCKTSSDNKAMSACLDTVRNNVEREFTLWINNQIFVLETAKGVNGRGTALNIFKRSITKYKDYREDDCKWQYLNKAPDVGADIVYKKCFIQLTKAKIKELEKLNHNDLTF